MPILRVFSPPLSIELKRKLAFELTEGLVQALTLGEEHRHRTMVQFVPVEADDVAIAGELISDGGTADFLLEVLDRPLGEDEKSAAVHAIMPIVMRHFGLRKEQRWKVNIRFVPILPEDFAVGGTFLDRVEANNPFALRTRAMQMGAIAPRTVERAS